jgi:hypothetical protein
LRGHERPIDVFLVQLVILAQARCDDFFQVKSHAGMFCDLGEKRK